MRDEKESTVVVAGIDVETRLPTMYPDDKVKRQTAPDIIEAILATLPGIETVYDFGCGRGVYVQAFIEAGVSAHGFDNNRSELCNTSIAPTTYVPLNEPTHLDLTDLIFSIEVAEHIQKSDCDVFFDNITRNSNRWIVFTGSDKPHSPGHVNPQSNEYWREKIVSRGTHKYRADLSQIVMDKCKEIIGKSSCLRWFQENLQVFERTEK